MSLAARISQASGDGGLAYASFAYSEREPRLDHRPLRLLKLHWGCALRERHFKSERLVIEDMLAKSLQVLSPNNRRARVFPGEDVRIRESALDESQGTRIFACSPLTTFAAVASNDGAVQNYFSDLGIRVLLQQARGPRGLCQGKLLRACDHHELRLP